MKITIVTPAPAGSRKGNRVTALRWARLLRQLGHRVAVCDDFRGAPCKLLIALHARRSFRALESFRRANPERPMVLALTGTDLYEDIRSDHTARRALEMATRLVVLQPLGIAELPEHVRDRARVIYQSCEAPRTPIPRRDGVFEICVLGHLRPVKDPFRTALAARMLPASSRIRVVHVGAALSRDMARAAHAEAAVNRRYTWLGDLPRWRALRYLARSRLLVLTSQLEGGANVISEAIAASVPVVSSLIPGSIGILGPDYPGFFPVADTKNLAALLTRVETDAGFYKILRDWCRRLRPLVDPARERQSWRCLIRELEVYSPVKGPTRKRK